MVIVQVRQAGGLGPGPRAHRGRRGVQADVHGGRGGGGSRGQCLGGRRVGVSVRAGLRARGAGWGRRPAERPAPAPAPPPRAIVPASGAAEGPPAGARRWRGEVPSTGLAAARSPAWPIAPGGPGGLRACPGDTFPSRRSLPRVRGGRSRYDTPPRNGTLPALNIEGDNEPCAAWGREGEREEGGDKKYFRRWVLCYGGSGKGALKMPSLFVPLI